ncbi:MAG: M28 family peptidase, partial [Candidatus Bathyarchaeia archaeon]
MRSEIDKEKLWSHVEYLCGIGEKFSGTPESKRAVDYFVDSVKEYGVAIEVHEFEAFLSYPSHDRSRDAELKVVEPEEFTLECQSHAMSASNPTIERELVDVGPGDLEDYEGKDVEGKVVLVDFAALWAPERLWIAQQKGAAGQITISGDPVIHDMIVTTIWGTPTRESSERIPRIPIVSVKHEDGMRLRELCRKGPVKIRMKVDIWRGRSKVYLPVVTIRGREEPDKYFLVHGHFCSWGDGMTDNVGGNAHFIEMAKILWKYRDRLRRGVKIAWWPGHSQGRYAGSTWFVDNFWEDLNENCIGQMNIDSPGVIGATEWYSRSSSELYHFNKSNMEEFSKEFIGAPINVRHSTWVFRAGDQSFTGIGVSRLGCNTNIPADSPLKGKTTGGGAGGWWWHTLQDTIDKGDKELL